MILWAGSVLCGACSIKRHSQREQAATSHVERIEDHAGIRVDSLVTRRGQVVRVDRRWEAVAPQNGWVYRFTEEVHITETEQTERKTAQQQELSVRQQEQHETTDRRQRSSQATGIRWWWWLVPVVLIALCAVGRWVLRWLRVWPSK